MASVTISNNCTEVSWQNPGGCNFIIDSYADVWKISVSAHLQHINAFLTLMEPAEIERAGRYRQVKDKNRFIVSRGALRIILGNYLNLRPGNIKFSLGPNNKPFIANPGAEKLHYNLSHSGDYVLLASSASAIGADVELVDTSFHYKEVLADNFSPEEIEFITKISSPERFFLLWTRKEALVKATGMGLDGDLRHIPSLSGEHYFNGAENAIVAPLITRSFKLNDSYIGSVTACGVAARLRFWEGHLSL